MIRGEKMDKYSITEKLLNPILFIVLAIITILTGTTYGIVNNISNQNSDKIASYPISVTKESTSDEYIITDNEVDVNKNINSMLDSAKKEYQNTVNPQKDLVTKVKKYFEIRYNFEGKASKSKDRILTEIRPIVTDMFFNNTSKQFDIKAGNGSVNSEVKDMKCKVLEVYHNRYSVDDLISKGINPEYFCLVDINSNQVLYKIKMVYMNEEWKINEQEFAGDVLDDLED